MLELFTADYYRGENYPKYFKTPHWKNLNVELIDSNPDAKCWICQKTNTLLLHHVNYDNLFFEKLGRDVFILCYDCHTRTHYHRDGTRVPMSEKELLKRMRLLKYTYPVRSFRLGSAINALWDRLNSL